MLNSYGHLLASGALRPDPAQRLVAERLQDISHHLGAAKSNGGLAGFFKRRSAAPKGLYLWGGVGGGKTLLMDMFFEAAPITHKKRLHFHEFMDEIHQNIAKIRAISSEISDRRDPVELVARPIIKNTQLLCFDEFHVSDITNAMLLGRLFERFFSAGMVVVATSNIAPDGLYRDGLNRQLFLPFIEMLKAHCQVVHLGAATDYRLDRLSTQPVFQFGAPEKVGPEMDRLWSVLSAGQVERPGSVFSLGREIIVPRQAMGAARFAFRDLCEKPLGARDYLAISHRYHTLVIDDVPRFTPDNSNAAKRFILLVDTFYDRGVKLAASFTVPLDQLSGDKNMEFAFRRAESRLAEMASDTYLSAPLKMDEQGATGPGQEI